MVTKRTLRWVLLAGMILLPACALVLDVEDVHYGSPASTEAGAGLDADSNDGAMPIDDSHCDLDHDGVRAVGACGGSDCNDNDPRVHPDAGFVEEVPPPGATGDWNCDGVVTPEFPTRSKICSELDCRDEARGILGDAGCGEQTTYVTCAVSSGTCGPTFVEKRPLGCR